MFFAAESWAIWGEPTKAVPDLLNFIPNSNGGLFIVKRLLFLTMLFVLVASASAFAAHEYDGDIHWGDNARGGSWGITYIRGLDDDQGGMETWFNIRHQDDRRYRKHLHGAYTEPGQPVDTYFGSRLGVNYSPYTAQFHGESTVLGLRIAGYQLANITLDGTYVFGRLGGHQDERWKGPFIPDVLAQDILFGARASFGEFNLRGAAVRHKIADEHHWNYSIMLEDSEVYPDIVLNGVYAFYGARADWLYEIRADWKVNPGVLEVRAGYRDSEIENVQSDEVLGCLDSCDERHRYINNGGRDAINRIYNRDQAYNIGATTWFNYGFDLTNRLDVDFTNTNPNRRGDLDDQLSARLQSDLYMFIPGDDPWKIDQSLSVLFPDANSTSREHAYEDEGLNRYDYRLAVTSPIIDLPYDIALTGLYNYDWDKNYQVDPRQHAVVGVRLERTQDIFILPNVKFGAIFTVDMPGRTTPVVQDPFKYVLRASYSAPNGAQFRLDYVSSKDFSMGDTSVHGEPVYERYDRYRMYGTDYNSDRGRRERFDGIRFVFALPF